MMRRLRWLIALAGLVGAAACQLTTDAGLRGQPRDLTGLTDATRITWTTYGRTDSPPEILIVAGADLTCTDPVSGKLGFSIVLLDGSRACREGDTLSPWQCSVSFHGEASWADTVLEHEEEHAALAREGRIDTDHTRYPDLWRPGGAVDTARAAVRAASR